MTELQNHIQPGPVRKRLKVLDALRGFALLGVCLANYKELTLYAFYDVGHTTNVEVSMMDQIANIHAFHLPRQDGADMLHLAISHCHCTVLWGWFRMGYATTMPEVVGAAIGVYLFEVACSFLRLRYFAYGPLEWIWRMLTYGKRLPLKVREL